MKIALLASASLSVPPVAYGGTERVVAMLADGLVAAGHEVTLFASGDSRTMAELVPTWPTSLAADPETIDPIGRFIYSNSLLVGNVAERMHEFDLIHSHVDEHALVLSKMSHVPVITTIHRKMDGEFQRRVYQFYDTVSFIGLSDRQRELMPDINWHGTVYNGMEVDKIAFQPHPDDYLLFGVGRMSPEKGPLSAIKIAQATGHRLILAAKIDPVDQAYFKNEIEPAIKAYPKAEFVGEVDFNAKVKLYRGAKALLFPIDWEEPFGLVMLESLAAGTPVIARNMGSVPEIIEHGVSGFVGETDQDLIDAVGKIDQIDRQACRIRAEQFSAQHMVENYLRVYREVLAKTGATKL